jgi:hypothetical protein
MALLISLNTFLFITYNFYFVSNAAKDRSLRQLLQGQCSPMQELPKAAIF